MSLRPLSRSQRCLSARTRALAGYLIVFQRCADDWDAAAARRHGDHDQAARHQAMAASCQALHHAYRERETVFAANMADRADWEKAAHSQRQLAVAADAKLRRRHPHLPWQPLCFAEPQPSSQA